MPRQLSLSSFYRVLSFRYRQINNFSVAGFQGLFSIQFYSNCLLQQLLKTCLPHIINDCGTGLNHPLVLDGKQRVVCKYGLFTFSSLLPASRQCNNICVTFLENLLSLLLITYFYTMEVLKWMNILACSEHCSPVQFKK